MTWILILTITLHPTTTDPARSHTQMIEGFTSFIVCEKAAKTLREAHNPKGRSVVAATCIGKS